MSYDGTMMVRIRSSQLSKFKKHCSTKLGRPYQEVMREMINAFNDGRLTITPTEEQKQSHGELYNVDRKQP